MNAEVRVRSDNIPLAVAAILFTVLALSLGDAIIKQISGGFPLWQIFVLRSLIVLPLLLAALHLMFPTVALAPRRPGWTAARSLMLAAMWVAYYAALPHVALSLAAAVYYTLPLFITLFAAFFAGEKVGPKGWFGIGLGFLGVVLILKPSGEEFNSYALLPLASAILYALSMILTRTKCRDEHPLVLSLSLNVAFIGMGAIASALVWLSGAGVNADAENSFLSGPWVAMDMRQWAVMALLAMAVIIGSVGAAIAYQSGPSSIVSTFDFSYLAFAALWGFTFFSEVPDIISALGIGLIAVAGILAIWRRPAV